MLRSRLVVAASAILAFGTALANAQPTPRFDPLNEPGTQGFGSMLRVSPFDPNTVLNSGDQWGAEITNDGGVTWQQCLGMTSTAANNPDENDFTFLSRTTVWCGSAAGPFESTDGGHTWTSMRSGMPAVSGTTLTCPIQKIIQDPNTPATLYAMSGSHRQIYPVSAWGQVWKSTNSGASWGTAAIGQVVPLNSLHPNVQGVNDCCFQTGSSSIMFAATNSGLYRSSNYGVTWVQVPNTPSVACYCVTVDPTNAAVLYAGFDVSGSTGNGVWKTSTATTTDVWASSNNGISSTSPTNDLDAPVYSVAVSPTPGSTGIIYLGFYNGATYYSSNAGGNWTKIVWAGTNSPVSPPSGVPGNLAFEFLSVDPSTPSTVWGTGASNVWRSTNSGSSWQTLTNFATNSAYRGNGCSGLDGTGAVWNQHIPGQVWTSGGDSGKQLRSNDYLWSWSTGDTFTGSKGPYNGSYSVSIANDGTVYIGTGEFDDSNGTYGNEPIIKWTLANGFSYCTYPPLPVTMPPTTTDGQCMSLYVLPTDSTKIWAVYGQIYDYLSGRIFYSHDSGTTWTDITPSGTSNVFNIAVDPLNTSYIYCGSTNGVYQSNSGGATFPASPMTSSPSDGMGLNFVYPDPSTTGGLYSVLWKRSTTSIYHLSSGTWTGLSYVGWMKYAFAVAVDPNNAARIAVVTKTPSPTYDVDPCTGIYLSSNTGSSWTQYNNLKLNSAGGIAFNPDDSEQLLVPMDGGDLVCDWGTSTAHGGTVPSIVGTLTAANYDSGGANIAYSGATAPSPSTVAGTAGQWIKYEVSVPTTGYYILTLNAKSSASGPQYHIEANGVNITGPIPLGNTSNTWTNFSKTVQLIAGTQYLKVYCETGGGFFDTITTSIAGAGSMSGSTAITTGGFNLTTLTPIVGNDWASYGAGGTSFTTFDDKLEGFSQISTASEYGGAGGNWGAYANTQFNVTWTDGTPTLSTTEGAIIYENETDPLGTTTWGIQFTVPASTVSHTLNVFWGGSQCTYALNAHLSDGSAVDYNTGSILGPGSGSALELSTITYQAASAGQTMTITLTKVSNAYTGGSTTGGSVNLTSAWLK